MKIHIRILLNILKNHKHDLVFCGYDKDGVAIINAAQENGIKNS